LVGRDLDLWIFVGNKSHYTKSPITQKQYSRIVKGWMSSLGVEDLNNYSTHSIRKTKSSEIFKQTQNVEVCRRLLGHSNITATSAYLGIEDSDALEVARNINI
jgi:site-specific recombinase XerD